MLITVYFPGNPYKKAIIRKEHVVFFVNLGAVLTQAEAEVLPESEEIEPEPEPSIDLNPDKGFGVPGSLQWHILKVKELKSRYSVYKYCLEVVDKGCDRRMDLNGHKKQTIDMIREHLKNDKNP